MQQPPKNQSQSKNSEVTRDLASRIASAKREQDLKDGRASRDASGDMSSMARGMRIATEFIAAILVGTVIGYLIDLGLGTSPWGLLTLFMVGFAAGIRNVIRVVAELNAAALLPSKTDAEADKRTDS
jgi:ATP synthase protein I